ncbi:DUF5999 family protein [Kitasatospora phosalacinea]|uniref:DUF5999 family protein n=1 Tax=Kitasatospora phosalacinea TaxID=2065 RepID=UPI0035D6CC42
MDRRQNRDLQVPAHPRLPVGGRSGLSGRRGGQLPPDQGWSLLRNGVPLFEDTGVVLPDGRSIDPQRLSGVTA